MADAPDPAWKIPPRASTPIACKSITVISASGEFTSRDGTAGTRRQPCPQCDSATHERGEPFDLVITDLTVPGGMGGEQAMLAMRALDPKVKAIVSSGYSSDPVLANFRDHGFSGRIAKPYQIVDFIRVVRQVLELR